jgi:hypothetical protein
MKPLPIPETEQLDAMVNGSIWSLLKDYTKDVERVDFREFITINRQKLVYYLVVNPNMAEAYFNEQLKANTIATHDIAKAWQEGSIYFVAWMDHGRPRNPRRFKTLAETVAELVLVNHGMY